MSTPTDEKLEKNQVSKDKTKRTTRKYGHDAVKEQQGGANEVQQKQQELLEEDRVSKKVLENKERMIPRLGIGVSFDAVYRELVYGDREIGMLYINGFTKDVALIEVMQRLSMVSRAQMVPNTLKHLLETFIPHIQVEVSDSLNKVTDKVLSGATVLFVDKEEQAILIDAKNYPTRSPAEPEIETVTRGSRDGFIETILANTTLTRRRIRDERLRIEMLQVGERSKTDVAVAYLKDVADPSIFEDIKNKINSIEVDGLPMADKQVEEFLIKKGWNPYPLVRYTERPDVASAHLLEGHVLVFVDTSPSAIILPATFFHHVQAPEDFRQTPTVGIYLRWVRFFGIFASLFLLPLWLIYARQSELLPAALDFIGPEKTGDIPIFYQFLFAEIGIDLMRMAAIHTPTPIATAMGLVAAVLIGEIAIKVGLFVPEVILYMAIAAIGTFATPSYELSLSNRVARLFFLISAYTFGVAGLVGSITLWVIMLSVSQSYKSPYLWPFIPFNAKAMWNVLIRPPFNHMKIRPSITLPQQKKRQP